MAERVHGNCTLRPSFLPVGMARLLSSHLFLTSLGLLSGHSFASDETAAPQRTFYVDTNSLGGSCADSNPGTKDRPWRTALKGFSTARPGDTVVFRNGIYRVPRTIHTSDLTVDPSQTGPFVFKSPAGEQAVITNLRPIAAADWTQIGATQTGEAVFATSAGRGAPVKNLTQHGVPLKRAFWGNNRSRYYEDAPPDAIAGPGEWTSSRREGRVFVCTTDSEPPGDSIELCDVPGEGGSGNLICLERNEQDRDRNLHLVFENLTFETGCHGLLIRTGFVELRQCVLRKSFGDLLNINTRSGRVIVDSCDFYAFGESAIDVAAYGDGPKRAGASHIIRNSRFHDNVQVRSPRQKGYNGVMLKGGCADVVVEANQFYNLRTTYGALTLGGATSGGMPAEGCRLTARNNVFRDNSGPCVVLFAGSHDCRLVNNLICNSDVNALVSFILAKPSDLATANFRPQVLNNTFYRNTVKRAVVSVSQGSADGLVIDHNLIAESGNVCLLDGLETPLKNLPDCGYQSHSVNQSPLFRDFSGFDFHPATRSPTIDRGADLRDLVPHDADGVRRPQGKAFDIGPFECRRAVNIR